MSVRQYIGARYVPRFVGLWNNTTQYEALDVVDNGSGTSYIARKIVPAGTPLNNTEYWFLYGASSGAIVDLQNRMSTAENDIVDLSNNKAQARKAIFFGNSYANGEASQAGKGLYNEAKGLYADSRLYFNGGVGFLPYTSHSITFGSLLNNAIADASGIAHDEVTDIIILSAWGDTLALKAGGQTAWSDIQTAMEGFVTTAKSAYPNLVNIKLAFVEIRSTRNITGTSEGTSYYNEPFEANVLMHVIAERCGIEYLGWVSWDAFMVPTMTQSDGYHPNALGNKTIGSALRAALDGSFIYYPKGIEINAACNIVPDGFIRAVGYITPYTAHLDFSNVSMSAGNTIAQYAADTLAYLSASSVNSPSAIPACFITSTIERGIFRLIASPGVGDDLTLRVTQVADNGIVKLNGQLFNTQSSVTAKSNGGINPNGLDFVFMI